MASSTKLSDSEPSFEWPFNRDCELESLVKELSHAYFVVESSISCPILRRALLDVALKAHVDPDMAHIAPETRATYHSFEE